MTQVVVIILVFFSSGHVHLVTFVTFFLLFLHCFLWFVCILVLMSSLWGLASFHGHFGLQGRTTRKTKFLQSKLSSWFSSQVTIHLVTLVVFLCSCLHCCSTWFMCILVLIVIVVVCCSPSRILVCKDEVARNMEFT